MLDFDQKLDLVDQTIASQGLTNVQAKTLESGLIVDFAKEQRASSLVRGLRSVKDFEYEIAIEDLNKVQDPAIETVYLVSSSKYRSISSSIVREIIKFNGRIDDLVPDPVVEYFKK